MILTLLTQIVRRLVCIHPRHIMQSPVKLSLLDQLCRGLLQEVPVPLPPAIVPVIRRILERIVQHWTPRQQSHVRLELSIAQLVEAPSLSQTIDQLPRGLNGASQQLSKHSTRILRPVLVRDQRPIGSGRTRLCDNSLHDIPGQGSHGQQSCRCCS